MSAITILDEAKDIVYGDRHAAYGSVEENFNRIAVGWSEIARINITSDQVGLMMIWLKLSRHIHCPKRDNLVDIAGYAETVSQLEDKGYNKIEELEPLPFPNKP